MLQIQGAIDTHRANDAQPTLCACSWSSKTRPGASGRYQRGHFRCLTMQACDKKQKATRAKPGTADATHTLLGSKNTEDNVCNASIGSA